MSVEEEVLVSLLLTSVERRSLKIRAHSLQPTVLVGNGGLTTAVASEIDRSLTAHELIKVRILGDDRNAREAILQRICDELLAAPVQHIGKILVVYRPKPDVPPKPPINIRRKPPRPLKRSFQNRR